MMGETLFIAHRIPFPPNRGDKIRSHHLLKALAALGPVHVATLGETAADFAAEADLARVARSHCLARRPVSLALAGLKALAGRRAVSLAAFDSPALRRWIAALLAERPIDTIVVFSGQMGQYVPETFTGRVVIDLCDVDSAKFDAYARDGHGARAWIDAREGRVLALEEARLATRAHATVLVSEAEANLLRTRIGDTDAVIVALGNGVDTDAFDPAATPPHPVLENSEGSHIVFTGQMDYAPNAAAAERLARRIMPAIRQRYASAACHIVGRAPAPSVRALDGINGTVVWGEVPDVRPFLAAAGVVAAPLSLARGIQNKVLEAMAMARPVVVSEEAATGIDASDGVHFAVGRDDQELIGHCLRLLADEQEATAIGANARRFVVEHKSWEAAMAPLAELIGRPERQRDAA